MVSTTKPCEANIEEVFTIKSTTNLQKSTSSSENPAEGESTSVSLEPDAVLCLLWHRDSLGGAYYKTSDKQLYVFNDICDTEPEFLVTKTVIREVNPRYIITIGNSLQPFVKCIIDNLKESEITINSDQPRTVPPNMSLLTFKEYLLEACLYKIQEIHLPAAPKEKAQKEVYLRSLINYSNQRSTHALGVLVKFLQLYWANFCPNDQELTFLHINQITLANHVLMDKVAFKALQVFQSISHTASFKHGSHESNYHEGLSVYKLFSLHIKSEIGGIHMRHMLSNPINDMSELNKRLDFIEFALTQRNQGLVDTLSTHLRKLHNLQYILSRIATMQATKRNWENLYKTIVVTLQINEICLPYRDSCSLINELNCKITSNLCGLEKSINMAIDFNDNLKRKRPVIKFGLDNQLDAKKLKLQDIAKNVTTAANFVMGDLPSYIDSCMVVHVPEVGYLVAIKEWEENCNKEQFSEFGFVFMFDIGGFLHYKNAMCKELDKLLGNLYDDIVAHENRIIQRLRSFVMKYNNDISEPLKVIALMDCLLSMAKVAKEKDYVRPKLNAENEHKIDMGRHPLLEDYSNNFVANDYHSGGSGARIKVITGPNASGKSIYLKQTAVLIYFAHIGSFLPAKKASIGMLHSVHCNLHATESASIRMSSFMMDVQQMAQITHTSRANSLIIVDEFGRGTTGPEGQALVGAVLRHFVDQGLYCSNIVVSTHFQTLSDILPEHKRFVNHMKMNYTIEDGQLVFLYKISSGMATSFSFDVAEALGFDDDIVKRAKEYYRAIRKNQAVQPAPSSIPAAYRQNIVDLEAFLTNVNIPQM